MFVSLRMRRNPLMRIGSDEPLSKTMISRGAAVCVRMESMHARSISPPPVASSTMKSTSFMIHAIEVRGSGETAQLDASAADDVHANAAVAAGGRKEVGIAADLNHRRCARG